jgi:Zn-dependent protease
MSLLHPRRTSAYRRAFRPSPVFFVLLAATALSGWASWAGWGNASLDALLFVVAGWLVTLSLHEYAHALTAYRSGDTGVATKGYLTLNLAKYTHPILSIALPVLFLLLGGIGLPGGAVWIDHWQIRGRWRDSLISLAGPAVNVLFTGVLVVPFALGVDVVGHFNFWSAVALLAYLQLTASVLNLAPIPGVDGGNAVRPWLTQAWQRGFDLVAPYGLLVFILLLFQSPLARPFFALIDAVAGAIGLPISLRDQGFALIRFS